MLLKLPTEIVLSISRLLCFHDKLRLNATCRKLNDLISKTTLYEDLNLNFYDNDTEEIIKQFEMEKTKGAQVKTLGLDIETISEETHRRLARIFPNVSRFSALHGADYHDYNDEYVAEPVATWIDTIEVFISSYDWHPLWIVLEDHTFPRLTVIEIEEEYNGMFCHTCEDGFQAPHLLPYIKNAPALEKLTLIKLDVSLEFLEELHRSCPCIKSLVLDHDLFVIDNDALPETIVPANSVTYLEITNAICIDRKGILLDYILKKYPNLKHLGFSVKRNERILVKKLNDYFPGSSVYLRNEGSNAFHESDLDSSDDSDNEIRITEYEYKKLISDFRSALEIYQGFIPVFFSRLPKTVNSLRVKAELFNNIITILSESNIKLVKLSTKNIRRYVSWSGDKRVQEQIQLAYLNDLTTLKTIDITLKQPGHIANHEIISTSVTRLTITIERGPLCIEYLLSAFPSLEYLCIRGYQTIQIGDNSEADARRINPNLRTIIIKNSPIQLDIFDYIKVVAPNVKELELAVTIKLKSTTEKIIPHLDLSGWGLRKCFLNIRNADIPHGYRNYNITMGNATGRFIFHKEINTVIYPGRLFSREEKKLMTYLNIKCDDIDYFKLFNLRIRKINNEVMISG